MTKQEFDNIATNFITQNIGKAILYLPSSIAENHGQCFDVVAKFANILGIPNAPGNPSAFPYVNAEDIYYQYGPFQAKYFDRIKNTPDYIPQLGDILVWDGDLNGGIGHTALATKDADLNYFISFDQNWDPSNWKPRYEWHDYDTGPVLGALRFKVTSSGGTTPPSNMDQKKAEQLDKIKDYLKSKGFNISDDPNSYVPIILTKVQALWEDRESQKGRAGKWDLLVQKAGIQGDTNVVTVQQLFDKIKSLGGSWATQKQKILDFVNSL